MPVADKGDRVERETLKTPEREETPSEEGDPREGWLETGWILSTSEGVSHRQRQGTFHHSAPALSSEARTPSVSARLDAGCVRRFEKEEKAVR